MRTCLTAKIATTELVHIDASLIRADISWESLVECHADEVMAENCGEEEVEPETKGRQSGKHKKVGRTDPELWAGHRIEMGPKDGRRALEQWQRASYLSECSLGG